MSEKPTSSNREARRKTVGEVVTVWISFLPALCVGRRIIAWGLKSVHEPSTDYTDLIGINRRGLWISFES